MSITNRLSLIGNTTYDELAAAINDILDNIEINEESLKISDIRTVRDIVRDVGCEIQRLESDSKVED